MGKPGRHLLQMFLPALIQEYELDLVIANAENIAHGFGVTADTANELLRSGVDILTSGNHIWDKKEVIEYIERESLLLRPANFPASAPGRGYCIVPSKNNDAKIGVLNLQGRIFMHPSDDPFSIGAEIVDRIRKETPIIFVDMHGEASSEKQAMGWFLDGKVTAVLGSHTHVPTADHRILPSGTAYVTDIGMTGPYDSIIGMEKDQILQRFIDQIPIRFEVAKENPILHAVLVHVDPEKGSARSIERIIRKGEE